MRDLFNVDYPDIEINKPIRLIELFGGYGSQAMALKRLGVDFESYFLCEFDQYAVKSYNAVHGTNFKPSDVCKIKGSNLNIKDKDKYYYLMTYSFPCTDLSIAGERKGMKKGEGTRSGLLWEVERILKELSVMGDFLPQCLFMENVPQVLSGANSEDFSLWCSFLENLGYTNYVKVLNAKDFGVAQNRERAFMFSFLEEVFYSFPEPILLDKSIKDYLEDEVEERFYLKNKKAKMLIQDLIEQKIINTKL